MNAAPPLMVVRDVSVRRGGRLVIEPLSLTIERGRIYLLRGANGSGKTSLLRALAGLAAPASGRVEIAERTAAFLGHSDGVKGALTARENIVFWRRLYGARTSDISKTNLLPGGVLDRRASALSAGQRRRLALCRIALSARPLWLLDEPTAGMDADSIKAVIDLVTEHCAGGGAAVIATHELLSFESAVTITLQAA